MNAQCFSKTVEIIELRDISDTDADEMAAWMAEAFYKSDDGPILYTGKTYDEDPEAHRLFFRAAIDRGTVCGTLLTTPDRKAHRMEFMPGQRNRILDTTWRSGKDAAWDKLIERCGGMEVFGPYIQNAMKPFDEALTELYGQDQGLEHVRSMLFGVKPGCQGQGIGRAMQEHTLRKAEDLNAKFFFCTNLANLPKYEKFGCREIARVPWSAKAYPGYPEGVNIYLYVESGRPGALSTATS